MLDKLLDSPEIVEEKIKEVVKEKPQANDDKKASSKKTYPSKTYDGTKKYDKPYEKSSEKAFQQKDNNRCYALFPVEGDLFKAMFNNEQVQFRLAGINLEGKTSVLAKKSYYFLNETIKKKNLYLKFEGKDSNGNSIVEAFLEPELKTSINKMMVDKGLSNKSITQKEIAVPALAPCVKTPSINTPAVNKDDNAQPPKQDNNSKKLDNCYVLWPVSGNKFVAMHKNERKEFILDNINLSNKKDPISINAIKFLEDNIKKKVVYIEFKGKDENGIDIIDAFIAPHTTTSINSTMIEHGLFKKLSTPPALQDTSSNIQDNIPEYIDQGYDSQYDDMYINYANQAQQNEFQQPVDDFFDNTPLNQIQDTFNNNDNGFEQPSDDFFDSMPLEQMQAAPVVKATANDVAPRKLKFPR